MLTRAEVFAVVERKAELARRYQGRHDGLGALDAAALVEAAIGRLPGNPRGFRYPPRANGEFWTRGGATADALREFHSSPEVDAWVLRAANLVQREVAVADRPQTIRSLTDTAASDPEAELMGMDGRHEMGLVLEHVAAADLQTLSDQSDRAERTAGGNSYKNARERAARAIKRAGYTHEDVIALLRCA